MQHASVHRLEPVAYVRQRTADDDAHRIIEVGLPHLVFEVDGHDFAGYFSHLLHLRALVFKPEIIAQRARQSRPRKMCIRDRRMPPP